MDRSDLAKRMKRYEAVPKNTLVRRMPVVIRIDGKSFHTFTRGFERPFDKILCKSMAETMKYLCENIQGCVLGYTQSDEISLLLVDYKKLTSDAWFDYEIQKMCSIAASMATMKFNQVFSSNVCNFAYDCCYDEESGNLGDEVVPEKSEDYEKFCEVYSKKIGIAMFDARAFNLPKEEVTNYFYWRQLDATRNSIQMVGQANFSHKELMNKTCNQIQDMLFTQKGINWNDLSTYKKRGSCAVKDDCAIMRDGHRSNWVIDYDIPIFKGDGREYIDNLILFDE